MQLVMGGSINLLILCFPLHVRVGVKITMGSEIFLEPDPCFEPPVLKNVALALLGSPESDIVGGLSYDVGKKFLFPV